MKSFKKACRGQKGFTLIELLVVIIILGVLAAVVTLAVTRFIGKGKLESANAELVTVQAAIESALAEGNAANFDAVVTDWRGDETNSPTVTTTTGNVTVFEMMRTHTLKAAYDIAVDGTITGADCDVTNGWGAEIVFNADDCVFYKP